MSHNVCIPRGFSDIWHEECNHVPCVTCHIMYLLYGTYLMWYLNSLKRLLMYVFHWPPLIYNIMYADHGTFLIFHIMYVFIGPSLISRIMYFFKGRSLISHILCYPMMVSDISYNVSMPLGVSYIQYYKITILLAVPNGSHNVCTPSAVSDMSYVCIPRAISDISYN